jgi:hypothetical protein
MLYIVWVNRVMAIPTPSRESFVFRQVSQVTLVTAYREVSQGLATLKGNPGHGDFQQFDQVMVSIQVIQVMAITDGDPGHGDY